MLTWKAGALGAHVQTPLPGANADLAPGKAATCAAAGAPFAQGQPFQECPEIVETRDAGSPERPALLHHRRLERCCPVGDAGPFRTQIAVETAIGYQFHPAALHNAFLPLARARCVARLGHGTEIGSALSACPHTGDYTTSEPPLPNSVHERFVHSLPLSAFLPLILYRAITACISLFLFVTSVYWVLTEEGI